MKYTLKYLVPILVFVLGISVMATNAYFYSQSEHNERIESTMERVSLIGNRITNEIEHNQLYTIDSFAELTRMFSKYVLEYLNIAKIYDENTELIFSSTPSKFFKDGTYIDRSTIEKVLLNKKSYIQYNEKNMQIDAVFLLAMPLKEGEIYSKRYGALYLQFDMSIQHVKLMENIYTYSLINGMVILIMVIVLALIIYFLILRRLSNLHKMTIELAQGNYDVQIESRLNDELGEVNRSFNTMVSQISKHKKELETKVDEAVEKNMQQSRVMMQQNRLVAMGEMINNIAHQWRQPLNTLALILQKFEILHQRGLLSEEKLTQNIQKGMKQIDKMSTTIDDFRDFFRQDKEMQVFYVKEMVDEAVEFMENALAEANIELTCTIEASTEMSAYKNELTQVVINLINNAKDALVDNRENSRIIDISCLVINEQMVMKVRDNAGGVPSDIIDKVFDPYFSTKEEGEGTGIGLYMSKMIIEDNMNGKLSVRNSADGAVFTITLSLDNVHPFCEISCDMKIRKKV